MLQYLVVRA